MSVSWVEYQNICVELISPALQYHLLPWSKLDSKLEQHLNIRSLAYVLRINLDTLHQFIFSAASVLFRLNLRMILRDFQIYSCSFSLVHFLQVDNFKIVTSLSGHFLLTWRPKLKVWGLCLGAGTKWQLLYLADLDWSTGTLWHNSGLLSWGPSER